MVEAIPIANRPISPLLLLEPLSFLRALGRVACAVGMRPRSGELATIDNQVLLANWPRVCYYKRHLVSGIATNLAR